MRRELETARAEAERAREVSATQLEAHLRGQAELAQFKADADRELTQLKADAAQAAVELEAEAAQVTEAARKYAAEKSLAKQRAREEEAQQRAIQELVQKVTELTAALEKEKSVHHKACFQNSKLRARLRAGASDVDELNEYRAHFPRGVIHAGEALQELVDAKREVAEKVSELSALRIELEEIKRETLLEVSVANREASETASELSALRIVLEECRRGAVRGLSDAGREAVETPTELSALRAELEAYRAHFPHGAAQAGKVAKEMVNITRELEEMRQQAAEHYGKISFLEADILQSRAELKSMAKIRRKEAAELKLQLQKAKNEWRLANEANSTATEAVRAAGQVFISRLRSKYKIVPHASALEAEAPEQRLFLETAASAAAAVEAEAEAEAEAEVEADADAGAMAEASPLTTAVPASQTALYNSPYRKSDARYMLSYLR